MQKLIKTVTLLLCLLVLTTESKAYWNIWIGGGFGYGGYTPILGRGPIPLGLGAFYNQPFFYGGYYGFGLGNFYTNSPYPAYMQSYEAYRSSREYAEQIVQVRMISPSLPQNNGPTYALPGANFSEQIAGILKAADIDPLGAYGSYNKSPSPELKNTSKPNIPAVIEETPAPQAEIKSDDGSVTTKYY